MKARSKRWCAKNGAQLKRNRRNRAKRRETRTAVLGNDGVIPTETRKFTSPREEVVVRPWPDGFNWRPDSYDPTDFE